MDDFQGPYFDQTLFSSCGKLTRLHKGGAPPPPPPPPQRGQTAQRTTNSLSSAISNRRGRRSTILSNGTMTDDKPGKKTLLGG